MTSVAIASRSFSNHVLLRKEISKRYGKISFNENGKTLKGNELIDFLKDHEMAILGIEQITEDILSQLPKLKVISRFGVGIDTIDIRALKKYGIKLAVAAGANKRSVAELVIAFALTLLRQLPLINQELKSGLWKQQKGRQLSNSCVGIVGFGAIGKDLAILLKAFNCNILTYDLINHAEFCNMHGFEQVGLDILLQKSDIVSLHLPLNENTQLILDANRLALMKSSAILINIARGGLVNEAALKIQLKNNLLAGAAFDVFTTEPPQDLELLNLPNFFCTPHIGGSTEEAIIAMGFSAIEGLEKAVIPGF